ncbi:SMP-30/gluconolactonase/LRE family protein [Pseudenhygromyxa sp. WMMC2535]|uniref:SMP-30/gluconolactonase/LRE family protein n=1 Tax=Pseudenhygromyxa sp. WMMC2535 TaxID=2712867 RepID=UPI0015572BD9|nr:SMP-30/gluconolactonase/LRE family protein [Pseudenhygromyxa sp. WMMC2535]NVB42723.1 SMP-30/gluconolactonase/LRE family protein [Pseudenhygromyxa sp. WMMC2535]
MFNAHILAKTLLPAVVLLCSQAPSFSAELVTTFADDELPEGVAMSSDGTLYVGILTTGEIKAVELDGTTTSVAAMELDGGFMPGLGIAPDGEIYVAASAPTEGSTGHGILHVDEGAGTVSLFAPFPLDTFPNHITFDASGDMLVSESDPGSIYKVDMATAEISLWADDPRLEGLAVAELGGLVLGANGSVFDKDYDTLYVSNSSTSEILAIDVLADGSAGSLTCFAGAAADCAVDTSGYVEGPDGVAFDKHGNLYIASGLNDAIVRISKYGDVDTIWSGYPLEWPTVLINGATPQTKHDLFTTNIDISRLFGGTGDPLPGVVRLNRGQ